jgi:hypothetical protein
MNYEDFLSEDDELSDKGMDYAIDSHNEGNRTLPENMPPELQSLIEEAWAVMDRGLF